jgi:ABC-type glycerol-3-phosphate transport system substrate-binding protein
MSKIYVILILLFIITQIYCDAERGAKGEIITITFWHSFVASTRNALDDLIQEFEKVHPTIKINAQYVPTGDALIQKLITAIQSKTAPDISWIHADFLDKLAETKAIYPIRQFIDSSDGLSEIELNDIFQPLLASATWKDTLMALPMEATSLALFYNKNLFKKAGLNPDTPPKTWDELTDFTRILTVDLDSDGKTDQYGFYVPVFPSSGPLNLWMILQWTPFLWQAGGNLLSEDKKTVLFNLDPGVKALEFWKQLYQIQNFQQFSMSHDQGFVSQSVAMILDGPWNLPRYRQIKKFEWTVAPLPRGPVRTATYLAGEHLVIFRQSAHPAEAWKLIKWILQPKTQVRFSLGSGYLPVNRAALEDSTYREYIKHDHALKIFIEQLDSGRERRLSNRKRVEFNRFVAQAIERCILGDGDPKEILDLMAESAATLLD